jgi:prepilin peptidase CpaA
MEQAQAILCIALLSGLLLGACWSDARTRRIPNRLVLAGTLAGLALNALLPTGTGLFSAMPGGLGFLDALGGFAVGLGALLPFYLLRTMGAGDVKLMAMTGAFLGPAAVSSAVLMTLLAGGILALAVAWRHGVVRSALVNVHAMLALTLTGRRDAMEVPQAVATLPYALAITAGTWMHIVLARSGHAVFS